MNTSLYSRNTSSVVTDTSSVIVNYSVKSLFTRSLYSYSYAMELQLYKEIVSRDFRLTAVRRNVKTTVAVEEISVRPFSPWLIGVRLGERDLVLCQRLSEIGASAFFVRRGWDIRVSSRDFCERLRRKRTFVLSMSRVFSLFPRSNAIEMHLGLSRHCAPGPEAMRCRRRAPR